MELPAGNWNYPTQIWFGNGRIGELSQACEQLGIRRPLLVTDAVLAPLDIVQAALADLTQTGLQCRLYSDVQGNPTGDNVSGGVQAYREGDHDGVIGFGGGSALDAAKTIALLANQDISLWELEQTDSDWQQVEAQRIPAIIAIPTTAGTGSEVGRAAVILDTAAQQKKIVFHPKMLPAIVISDPQLTVGLPANITAWTGVDALVHALEAYCAPGFHPMAEGIAVEAIRMICRWLPLAVAEPNNLEARGNMLVAASMGATAFQKGLGSVHSVSHVLGALYNTHHGLANAIILPYGIKQNLPVIEDKLSHLATVLGLANASPSGFLDFILDFRQQLGIPHTLAEVGIDASRAIEIGTLALQDPTAATNARPLTAADLENLFRAAVAGSFENL
jgi:alcohol dehydrogenase class IV